MFRLTYFNSSILRGAPALSVIWFISYVNAFLLFSEHLLKKPLTVIDQFHSHLEPMKFIRPDTFQDQVESLYLYIYIYNGISIVLNKSIKFGLSLARKRS